MNVCTAMQRCMQSCYVRLVVASATGVPWQNQHLQSAAPCVSAPQNDAFTRQKERFFASVNEDGVNLMPLASRV